MALISPQGRRREGEASEAGVEDFDGVPATDVDPATAFERGVALEEGGKPEEADSWYRLAADAGHPAAANNLGLLLIELSEKDKSRVVEAQDALEKALARGPDRVEPKLNLAILLGREGQKAKAKELARMVAEGADDPDYREQAQKLLKSL
jgi:TPR repeat protein